MRRVIFVTGAGISVESGIRAFRTDTASGRSMWDEYDINEVCNLEAFNAGFRLKTEGFGPYNATDDDGLDLYTKTHDFYNMRRQELGTVEPNLAHLRIAEWYGRYSGQVVNFTTNVDDLLERAGVPREEVIHAHGYLKEMRVKEENYGSVEKMIDVGFESYDQNSVFWAKPNVTFFYETAPWYMGQITLFDALTAQDLVVVVGCSNQVINFNWEIFPALKHGCKMMVVNPGIDYMETQIYEEYGVPVFRAGAVETFGNKHFIKIIEDHLEG